MARSCCPNLDFPTKTASRIAPVTGANMAKPDPETHLLDAALAELGIDAPVIPWDAPED